MHSIKSGRPTILGIALAIALAAPAAKADTVLIFENTFGFRLVASELLTYGDRVTSNVQGGLVYGADADTPNVVADFPEGTSGWSTSYGDLSNVIYRWPSGTVLEMTLTADPGYQVLLHAFDLAGWSQADYTINSVEVRNGDSQVLFSQANVLVQGDANGPRHTSFSFLPLSADALTIRVDATNLTNGFGSQNVGLDNVRFSQVPEPASWALLALGLPAIALLKRKRGQYLLAVRPRSRRLRPDLAQPST